MHYYAMKRYGESYSTLLSERSQSAKDVLCVVTQLCLTLCDAMDYRPPGSSDYGGSLGKNIGVGCHALIQGIFSTWGLKPGLLHCRWILYL